MPETDAKHRTGAMRGVLDPTTIGATGNGVDRRADAQSVGLGSGRVDLSPTESRLLAELANRPGVVVAKQELLRRVWGDDATDPHVVEVTIGRLRRRLGSDGPVIETVRRRGYVLRAGAGETRPRAI
jgi:DNA-binding response OmpR family regulator